jgi:hypothetical protein
MKVEIGVLWRKNACKQQKKINYSRHNYLKIKKFLAAALHGTGAAASGPRLFSGALVKQEIRIDRRGVLECMIWAGTGVIWTLSGGVPKSSQLLGIENGGTGRGSVSINRPIPTLSCRPLSNWRHASQPPRRYKASHVGTPDDLQVFRRAATKAASPRYWQRFATPPARMRMTQSGCF